MSLAQVRRYYLLKRLAATLRQDDVVAGVWRAKQEAEPGVALADAFPYHSRLLAAGYSTFEDVYGASVEEFQRSGFTSREGTSILSAVGGGPWWTPQDETGLVSLYEKPWYASAGGGVGTWTARAGGNLTQGAGTAPPSTDGAPDFAYPPVSILEGSALTGLATGDHHLAIATSIRKILSTLTSGVYSNESLFKDANEYLGFFLRVTEGQYFVDFYEWDTAERKASLNLGTDIPGDLITIEGKKTGGRLWIRANAGTWVQGDACGDVGDPLDGGMMFMGVGTNCRIDAFAAFSSAKSDTFGRYFDAWARAL